MAKFLIVAFVIVCFLGVALMLGLGKLQKTWPLGQQQRKRASNNASSPRPRPRRANYNQLLKMLNGDAQTAERLVNKVRLQNPTRSEDWCWEKVISDLKRDRRA